MPITNIIVLGAGPCGLSAAIALARSSSKDPDLAPLRVTVVELRAELQTIGGTVNLTPLAMRYLDSLGAGARLRRQAIDLDHGLDYVSLRTGRRVGNIWGGIGALRIARHGVVESLLETVKEHPDSVEVQWGKRLAEISENTDEVVLKFTDGTTLRGDILLGCDGLHSSARQLWVEPEREKMFTGRVVAMGWHRIENGQGESPPAIRLSTGEPALRDTSVVSSPNGMLLMSYYEPTRSNIYFADILCMKEPDGDARDGWKVIGDDKEAIKKEVVQSYQTGRVEGLLEPLSSCQNWHLYPVYMLPAGGRWHRGKVLLLGDAAHAMPPQGESTGLAIEDAVLIAHVLGRRRTRTVAQLFSDYEQVRRAPIDRHYKDAVWALEHGFVRTSSWILTVLLEWAVCIYLLLKRWGQRDHFAGDVRNLSLPA